MSSLINKEMLKKVSLAIFIIALLFSLAGWLNYARFVYITSIDPNLTIQQYDAKYFSKYPAWLNGVNEINIASIIILVLAIILMAIFIYIRKQLKVPVLIILILDGLIILMLLFAYM